MIIVIGIVFLFPKNRFILFQKRIQDFSSSYIIFMYVNMNLSFFSTYQIFSFTIKIF
uniref:Uncharacterized protein n=1 Tax=Lotus japonicus TaxID=34305 RepID=I3S5A7_LOTJA|nr:unknown [Lotus japonicus]